MMNTIVEQENLRQTVSQMVAPVLTLPVLREIDRKSESCRKATDLYRALAVIGDFVARRVREAGFPDKLDPDCSVDAAYGKALDVLADIRAKVERSIENVRTDPSLNGTTHRGDLDDGYKAVLAAVHDLHEVMTELRTAIADHDALFPEIELSQEQLEHVQRCMQNPRAPAEGFATGVTRLKALLASS